MNTPGLRPALRWLLVGSLALNAALLAGIAWQHVDHGPRRMHRVHVRAGMMPSPQMLRAAVPESRRAVVDQVLQRHHEPIRESVRGVFQARAAIHGLLTAERIDPAALDRAFATLRERDAQAARAVQVMLTDLVSQLTPQERRALAETVQRRHHGRHPAREDTPPPHPPNR